MKNLLQKFAPFIIAIVGFIILGYAYAPYTLSGKVVNQSDISSWHGMSKEIVDWNDAHPDDPTYWTNSMFSGMPANTISIKYQGDLTKYLYDLLLTGQRPASYLIISMIGAFLMFLAFGVNIWLAILGAITVSFCSYNMQIIQVGHNTKMIAIAFIPWVIAALVYAYRKNWLLGGSLFGLALSFQIKANHPQITYYLAIIVLGFAIWQLCKTIKNGSWNSFLKSSGAVLVGGVLGILVNINHLWPTYEYSQQSMRGGSELAQDGEVKTKGLDLEYATQWSYGIEEIPNLLIPNFNGGASAGELSTNSQTYKTLNSYGYSGANQIIKQLPLYWGPQPFTAGPMYLGAITLLLCVFGLFIIKGGLKWWLLGVSILAIILSWGYHFLLPTKLFFEYVPLYNKFRTVSMILVILQITTPLLAILGLNKALNGENNFTQYKKPLLYSALIVGGFSLIFTLLPSLAGNFISSSDSQLPAEIASSLREDRAHLLSVDAFRSFVFVLFAATAIYFTFIKKLQLKYLYIILIALVLIDLWGIDKRYLNASHFVTQQEFSSPLKERMVDKYIKEDCNLLSYRVLDLSVDPFNNAYTSYWHKTIGGYSPAKLQRYQDLIERGIMPEINQFTKDLNESGAETIQEANDAIGFYPILSMLNMKYIIINGEGAPITNKWALGNCWFVDSLIVATDAKEEIDLVKQINPQHYAIVNKEDFDTFEQLRQFEHQHQAQKQEDIAISESSEKEGLQMISLSSYAPNKLTYKYTSSKDQIALFSEVFYSPGWRATFSGTLDGKDVADKELPIIRANYILRGLALAAGEGEITFYYQPESIVKGAKFSLISSILLLLFFISTFVGQKLKR